MQKIYFSRIIDSILADYLESFGAVLLIGPKWCGKTTTAEQVSKSSLKMQDSQKQREYIKLSDTSPDILLEGETPRLLGEWQIAPALWDAVRNKVDDRKKVAQFILTGSSIPKITELMQGSKNIASLVMRPMSLYESMDSSGAISLSDVFHNKAVINGVTSNMSIKDLSYTICRGGWPSSLGKSENSSLLIAKKYICSICDNDVTIINGIVEKSEHAKLLLESYARHISSLASNDTLLADISVNYALMDEHILYTYLNVLKRIYVFDEVPAWCPSIRPKAEMCSLDKKEFIDPSLGIAALGLTPKQLLLDFTTFELYFEAMCIRDLKVYSQGLDGSIFYYKDNCGLEVDAVIRLKDGRYALIDMKLESEEIDQAAASLLALQDLIKQSDMNSPSFLMVITGGESAYVREDGVIVVPLACLKD